MGVGAVEANVAGESLRKLKVSFDVGGVVMSSRQMCLRKN